MKKYDLLLTGTVGWSITTDYVKYVLDKSKGQPVSVAISSLGGYVDTGLQIYELFKMHGAVNVEFLGMSASAATFMAMGAKSVRMAKNALILIHNSAQWINEWGTKNKEQIDEVITRLKFQRDQLSTIDDVLAQIYASRNGKPIDEVKEKMKVAAWIKAADAQAFGIVDEITDDEKLDGTPSNKITNSIINELGLPPLPSAEGEESPASLLQKAMQLLKGLGKSFANNQEEMKITVFATLAGLLAVKDGFEADEKGNVSLTQDQLKKIDDQLKDSDDACKKAKEVIDSQKEEIKTLKAEKETMTEEIKNLKAGAGELGNGGKQAEGEALNGAAELWNSIKGA
jgi:ATP-dependent protease ClpP protease subunit